jgi:hypothetical protein
MISTMPNDIGTLCQCPLEFFDVALQRRQPIYAPLMIQARTNRYSVRLQSP